jgi:hypothetical protein
MESPSADRRRETLMLQVTEAAVSVLRSEVLHEGDPQMQSASASAVRIRSSVTDDGRQTITLQPVAGPEPGDASTEAENLDVFVAPELAGPLDAGVLDVEATPEGPELVLREQSDQN